MDGAPEQPPARLVISLLAGEEGVRTRALARLVRELGPLVEFSRPLPFDHSDYYQPEMGPGLTRRLAVFQRLVSLEELVRVKRLCLEIEAELSREGRRRVNLDPGLLNAGAWVLATTKYRNHRICLARGLYAEATLLYQDGGFQPLPWTYPDYAGQRLRRLLECYRRRYLWQLKNQAAKGDRKCPNP